MGTGRREVICIDIGGTSIKAARVNALRIKQSVEVPSPPQKAAFLKAVVRVVNELSQSKECVSIGSPGPLDSHKGVIINPPNIPLKNFNLRKYLIKNTNANRVIIENDANAFVFGEAITGAGRGMNTIVGLTLGTGVGGGVVINKELLRGRGNAGELGHMIINYDGVASKEGGRGQVEEYLSARGFMRIAGREGLKAGSPKEAYILALKGNRKALNSWRKYGQLLGITLASINSSFDADMIVLGGKISNAYRFFSQEMNRSFKKTTLLPLKGRVPIRKAVLKESALNGLFYLAGRSR